MKKEKKMKSSEALKLIRKTLEKEPRYVCLLLLEIHADKTNVFKNIQNALKVEGSVTVWLKTHHPEVYYKKGFSFKRYRLAWINWLIPQYEAVGD